MSKEMAHTDANYRFESHDRALVGLARAMRHRTSRHDRIEWTRTLRQFHELDGYDDTEIRHLTDCCHPFSYPQGWVVLPKASHAEHCLFITEGHVRVINGPRAGLEFGPGDIVGVQEMRGDRTIHGAVVALDHVEGVAVDDEALLAAHPARHAAALDTVLSPA
jgi:hypothetical protein